MSFSLKFNIFIFSIIVFLLIIISTMLYMVMNLSIVNDQIISLREKNIEIIEENFISINQTIDTIKNINDYLNNPDLPENLALLNRMSSFIDIDNEEELRKVVEISRSTPLDLYTSSVILGYSKKFDIPSSLILALIEQESNFNQYEVGEHMDRGYCQIIPDTEKWLANDFGHLIDVEYNTNRIYEPEYNIGLGVLYLHNLKRAYGENYHKILSEYNRGIYNLKKYYNEHGTYVTTYSRGILSRETKYKVLN